MWYYFVKCSVFVPRFFVKCSVFVPRLLVKCSVFLFGNPNKINERANFLQEI